MPATIPTQLLIPSRIVALNAPDALIHPYVMQLLAARTHHGERVGAVIGHNRFALYTITRWAHQHHVDAAALLNHIDLSRAFTCFQLHRRIVTLDAENYKRWRALFVLGLLDTFYDESVEYHRAARLVKESLAHLKQIARSGLPVLITFSLPKQTGREGLVKLVASEVDAYWEYASNAPPASPTQLQMPLLGQACERRS